MQVAALYKIYVIYNFMVLFVQGRAILNNTYVL